MSVPGYAISNSDEEILNALIIADDIGKEFVSNFGVESSCHIIYENEDSVRTKSVSYSTNDGSSLESTFGAMGEISDSFVLDTEFQAVSQDVQTIYVMNDIFTERKQKLEMETKSYIKIAMKSAQEILTESILNKRFESTNLVVKHILTIANQMCKIKQALQDEPLKSTLKVLPSCQEDVIQFFQTADAIIKKMQEDGFSNKNFSKVIPMNEEKFHSKLQCIITGLTRRLDILSEFRSSLSTTEDSESGIESNISEMCKSESQEFIFEQISANDSGLHSSIKPE